jgi:Domain of unknown function (DUF4158)
MDEGYGRFGSYSRVEVERFFHLDDEDRRLVAMRRRDYNRLGFAVQMVTVRHLGMFLPDPLDVPLELVEYLAEQLGINATFVSTPKSATNRSSAAAYVSRVFAMLIVPRYTWTASARCTPPAGAGSIRTRPILGLCPRATAHSFPSRLRAKGFAAPGRTRGYRA